LDKHKKRINALLRDSGAELIRQKKHKIYRLTDGRNFVQPSTPSDTNAYRNGERDLIRLLSNLPKQDAKRTTARDPEPVGATTAVARIGLPNNPPRGEPGTVEVLAQHKAIPPKSPAQPNFPDEFDFDFLLDDLNELRSYRELTASGKAQVLIKRLAKNHVKVRVVPAIEVGRVTARERRFLEENHDVPPSFHDRSRCSIVPVLLIHKGGLLGLPEFDLALEVGEPHMIGVVRGDSFVPAMTFQCGTAAYTIVWDGSIDFPKDEQWYPHRAVRAVLRELTARDNANGRAMAAGFTRLR